MAIQVEHELHQRRKGRNLGVLALLLAFVALIFGLTIVKARQLGSPAGMEGFDHIVQPQLLEGADE
jgi:hypothetical protein